MKGEWRAGRREEGQRDGGKKEGRSKGQILHEWICKQKPKNELKEKERVSERNKYKKEELGKKDRGGL